MIKILPYRNQNKGNISVTDISTSVSKYSRYTEVTIKKYANGEGTIKAKDIEPEKYTGYTYKGYKVEVQRLEDNSLHLSKDKKKVLIKWKQRSETNPYLYDDACKIYKENIEEVYRYVDRETVKGGAFIGKRHEWKKGQEIIQTKLTDHGKKTLKRSSRIMKWQNDKENMNTNFITLTYGKDAPDCKTAKTHLKQFIQRLSRKLGKDLNYIWVAEMQKGKILDSGRESFRLKHGAAIHFHILIDKYLKPESFTKKETDQYAKAVELSALERENGQKISKQYKTIIQQFKAKERAIRIEQKFFDRVRIPADLLQKIPRDENYLQGVYQKKWIQKNWNDIVGKWQNDNNKIQQLVNRNDCEKVIDAGKYISKYMSKNGESIIGRMWGISDHCRRIIQPVEEKTIRLQTKYAEKILQEAGAMFFEDNMCQVEEMEDVEFYHYEGSEQRFKRRKYYNEIPPVNYICITDKLSKFFQPPKDPPGKIITTDTINIVNDRRIELDINGVYIKGIGERKDFIYTPDYPIMWTNNINLLEEYLQTLILFYDKFPEERKNIVSLRNKLDSDSELIPVINYNF